MRLLVLVSMYAELIAQGQHSTGIGYQSWFDSQSCTTRNASCDEIPVQLSAVGGACVQRPVNHPISMYVSPNASLEFATQGSWDITEWARRTPNVNVTSVRYKEDRYKDSVPFLVKHHFGPDIMTWWAGPIAMHLKDNLLDLKPLLQQHGIMHVLEPFAYKSCQDQDGKIYCISHGVSPWWFMMYRGVFEKASLVAPRTFEELMAACHKLRDVGIIPIALAAQEHWSISAFFDLMNIRTNGPDFHAELCEGSIPYTDLRVRRTFERWQSLIDARCFPENPAQYGLWGSSFIDLIRTQQVAMIFMADWYRGWPWNINGNMDDIDVFPFPEVTGGVKSANMFPGDAFIVRRSTEQTGPVGSLLSTHFLAVRDAPTDDNFVRISPRKDSPEFDGRFQRKAKAMVSDTDVLWTAFDLVVPRIFYDGIKEPLVKWVNGSFSLEAMLKHFEQQRIQHYQYQNVPPEANTSSGSYQDSVVVSLRLPDVHGAGQADAALGIRFSINDGEVSETYRTPVKLGPGNWSLRAQTFGGKLANSPVVKFHYHVAETTEFDAADLIILVPFVASLIVLIIICKFIWHYRRMRLAKRNLEMEREMYMERKLDEGLRTVAELGHPMVLLPASEFEVIPAQALRTWHEGLRDARKLRVLDSIEQILLFQHAGKRIVFFSYQWLSWDLLGPDDIQLPAMRRAISKLAAKKGLTKSNIYVWLDVVSIPQAHHNLKRLAVDSLYVYAAVSNFVLIIAPVSMHSNLSIKADAESYLLRTWTRAEQLSHATSKGLDSMFLYDGGLGLTPISEAWISSAIYVFEGEMTCCRKNHPNGVPCDRQSLVAAMLGLFYEMYSKAEARTSEGEDLIIWKHISKDLERVFPSKMWYATEGGGCEQELFGDMITRVTKRVACERSGGRPSVREEYCKIRSDLTAASSALESSLQASVFLGNNIGDDAELKGQENLSLASLEHQTQCLRKLEIARVPRLRGDTEELNHSTLFELGEGTKHSL